MPRRQQLISQESADVTSQHACTETATSKLQLIYQQWQIASFTLRDQRILCHHRTHTHTNARDCTCDGIDARVSWSEKYASQLCGMGSVPHCGRSCHRMHTRNNCLFGVSDAFYMHVAERALEKERRKLGCPPKFRSPKLMRPCAVFGHATADVFVIECCVIFQMPLGRFLLFSHLLCMNALLKDTMRFAKLHYYVRLVALSTITLNWVASKVRKSAALALGSV